MNTKVQFIKSLIALDKAITVITEVHNEVKTYPLDDMTIDEYRLVTEFTMRTSYSIAFLSTIKENLLKADIESAADEFHYYRKNLALKQESNYRPLVLAVDDCIAVLDYILTKYFPICTLLEI